MSKVSKEMKKTPMPIRIGGQTMDAIFWARTIKAAKTHGKIPGVTWFAILSLALVGCSRTADLVEFNPTNPLPYQLAHVTFTTRADMLHAVETHAIDPSKVDGKPWVCIRSATPIPVGTRCSD